MAAKVSVESVQLEAKRFWKARKASTDKLLRRTSVALVAGQRMSRELAKIRPERSDIFGKLPSFDQLLEESAEDLASLPVMKAQSTRAKRSRAAVAEDGRTSHQILADLAEKPEYRDLRGTELWPHFLSELEGAQMEPKEVKEGRKVEFTDRKGKKRRISFGHFSNLVSKSRSGRISRRRANAAVTPVASALRCQRRKGESEA